ncbi:MAG: hypothetical protein U1B80_04835, partial [Anaerolineaceae bacterium]|nr:hypothetical protein [Anaerolineaceae bacterium]
RVAHAAALTTLNHQLEILDLRQETDPLAASSYIPPTGCAVWAQGEPIHGSSAFERSQLAPAETLAVLTVPPGRAEFLAALDLVKPKRVILFGFKSASDELSDFLTRLAGLARYALRAHNGVVALAQLASATCQREATIQKGIEWLAANGHITFEVSQHGLLHLQAGGKADPQRRTRVESELAALLHETAAYREYFLRADTSFLTQPRAGKSVDRRGT